MHSELIKIATASHRFYQIVDGIHKGAVWTQGILRPSMAAAIRDGWKSHSEASLRAFERVRHRVEVRARKTLPWWQVWAYDVPFVPGLVILSMSCIGKFTIEGGAVACF